VSHPGRKSTKQATQYTRVDRDNMATSSGDATLFDDSFTVTEFDQSKYDRVARIKATSNSSELPTELALDINTELFPCSVGENLHIILATSLSLDGSKDDDKGWKDVTKSSDESATLADSFDYVCHGKIYKFEDDEDGQYMCVSLTLIIST
jgi:DNA-directed RNA polymerase I, II, and III subunit RPABC3